MRFSTFFLALVPFALAAPFELEERANNAAKVLTDLKNVSAKVKAFNATLNTFADDATIPGGTLVKLENQNSAIISALTTTTNDAKSSSAFTQAQSKSIIAAVKALEPVTFSTLNNVVAHKPAFAKTGVTSLVKTDLTNQKSKVAALGTALKAKAAAPYKAQAGPIQAAFAAKFTAAINQFN